MSEVMSHFVALAAGEPGIGSHMVGRSGGVEKHQDEGRQLPGGNREEPPAGAR